MDFLLQIPYVQNNNLSWIKLGNRYYLDCTLAMATIETCKKNKNEKRTKLYLKFHERVVFVVATIETLKYINYW